MASVQGTWDIAVFRVPAGREAALGKGSITISGTPTAWTIRVRGADGSDVMNHTSSGGVDNMQDQLFIQRVYFGATGSTGGVEAYTDGRIVGSSQNGAFAFRNYLQAYGRDVPAIFGMLAGTYNGVSQANTCSKPPVEVTVAANGDVRNKGKGNLSCGDVTIDAKWDGNDDFIELNDVSGGFNIKLETSKGGGSSPSGGITLHVASITEASPPIQVDSGLNGLAGNVTTNAPLKVVAAANASTDGSPAPLNTCGTAERNTYSAVIDRRMLLSGTALALGGSCHNGFASAPANQTAFCNNAWVRRENTSANTPTCVYNSTTSSGTFTFVSSGVSSNESVFRWFKR
jgi:hypothetical protein